MPIDPLEWATYVQGRNEIKNLPGVHGVGLVGPHIEAYVEKITPDILREVPETLDGIPITLKEIKKFRLLSFFGADVLKAAYPGRGQAYRPCPGGVSIGHYLGETGTHGCAINLDEGGIAGISNNHVTGLDWGNLHEGNPGDPIMQPGPLDYSGYGGELGYLLRSQPVPLKSAGAAQIDASVYTGEFSTEILGLGVPSYSVEMEPGMIVSKSGSRSAVTSAVVQTVGAVVDIEGYGEARFENAAITDRAFSIGGDSGSCVLNQWAQTCGLVFAGNEQASVICEARMIEQQLGVKFGFTEPHLLDLRAPLKVNPLVTWVPMLVGGIACMFMPDNI